MKVYTELVSPEPILFGMELAAFSIPLSICVCESAFLYPKETSHTVLGFTI